MRTFCDCRALSAFVTLATMTLPSVWLPAQTHLTIQEVHEDAVLVRTAEEGGSLPHGFVALDLFDVYESWSPETGYLDFVDSIYVAQIRRDGMDMRYVWDGERKFLKHGYYVVYAGRRYRADSDAAPIEGASAGGSPWPLGLSLGRSTLPGSFGVSGLQLVFAAGGGGTAEIGSGLNSELMGGGALVYARVRYSFAGVSVRGAIPISGAAPFSVSACVDLHLGLLEYFGMSVSGGASVRFEASGASVAPAFGYSVYAFLPVFGEGRSLMPYAELYVFAPDVRQTFYFGLVVGLKL